MASPIREEVANLVAVVLERVVDLSVVAPKVAGQDKAVKVDRADKAKIAIKAKKSIMDSLLLWQEALKLPEMGLNAAPQKGANPLTKGLENPEIQAKASDF